MAVISANISFNRGGHELLDISSKHLNYSAALAWAKDPHSNAAVGQFIYIEEDETVLEKKYAHGAYTVDVIGEFAILTPLAASVAGGDFGGEISGLKTDVAELKKADKTLQASIDSKVDQSVLGAYAKKEDLGTYATKSELGAYAEKESLKEYVKTSELPDLAVYDLKPKAEVDPQYASQYEFTKNGEVVTTINIKKDQFLKSAKYINNATEEDVLASKGTIELGSACIKFIWQIDSQEPMYVPAGSIASSYKGSEYILIGDGNSISLKLEELKSALSSVFAAKSIETSVNANTTKLADVTSTVGAEIDSKIAAHKLTADEEYKAVTVVDWSDTAAIAEKAIQVQAVKAKFGEMAKYFDENVFSIVKVSELPNSKQSANKVYLLDKGEGVVEENIWVDGAWHVIGSSIYYTKAEIQAAYASLNYVNSTFLKKSDSLTTDEVLSIINSKK